jgi:hypothetical protein
MTDHYVKVVLLDQSLQSPSTAPNRKRIPYSYLTELMNGYALGYKLARKPAFKTDTKLRLHFRTEMAVTSEGDQKRLHAAVKVTRIDVQNTHQEALIDATLW